MNSNKITNLAIKRHDIDASDFQKVYENKNFEHLNKKETVFLHGRTLVLEELELVLSSIPKNSKILDVGCGTGHLTQWIKNKGYEVYGIEPSEEMYNFAKKNFPEIEIKKGISSEIPYEDNFFDLIVAFEVLRYLDKSENLKTFSEFNRVLKNDGTFFVTQVNLFSTDLYFIFHKLKSIYCKMFGITHHHCNFTTSSIQESQVKKAGFKTVNTIGRFLGSARLSFKFGKTFGNFYYTIVKMIFGRQRFVNFVQKNMAAHLIVIAKK